MDFCPHHLQMSMSLDNKGEMCIFSSENYYYCLHIDHLRFSLLLAIYCKEKLKDALLYEYSN